MSTVDDLVTWLRAQWDDEERLAKAAGDPAEQWWWSTPESPAEEHIARYSPARALAEVDAKRRILDMYVLDYDADGRAFVVGGYGEAWLDAVRLLALPYADRPGYREDWRP